MRNDFAISDLGWVSSNKRKVESSSNVASDDKIYRTYKSATQKKFNSGNVVWPIKIINKK